MLLQVWLTARTWKNMRYSAYVVTGRGTYSSNGLHTYCKVVFISVMIYSLCLCNPFITCTVHILYLSKSVMWAYKLNASPCILYLTVKCLSGCCLQNIKALQWVWSAIFVVGWYDLKLGGGALSLCLIGILSGALLCCIRAIYLFFFSNRETNIILLNLFEPFFVSFRRDIQGILLGGCPKPQTCLGHL